MSHVNIVPLLDLFQSRFDFQKVSVLLNSIQRQITDWDVQRRAKDLLEIAPHLVSIEPNGSAEMGDEGQTYMTWENAELTFNDGRKVTIEDLSYWEAIGCGIDVAKDELEAFAAARELDPEDSETLTLFTSHTLGVEDFDDAYTLAESVWSLVYLLAREHFVDIGRIDLAKLADRTPLDTRVESSAAGNALMLQAVIASSPLLADAAKAATLGLIDPAVKHAGAAPLEVDLQSVSGPYADLREVFAGTELPDEDAPHSMCMKMAPFDVRICRTGEGVSAEIYALDGRLDTLAECFAFNVDAMEEAA